MSGNNDEKEIKAIYKKYMGSPVKDNLIGVGVSGTLFAIGAGIGLVVTGGIGHFIAGAFMLPGFIGGGISTMLLAAECLPEPNSRENNYAQQVLEGKMYSHVILGKMEANLRSAFNKASAPHSRAEKEKFLKLADEIEQEVKTLSSVFKIISGGPNGFGTDKYEFILLEQTASDGKKELVTLTQALQNLNPPVPQKPKDGFNI